MTTFADDDSADPRDPFSYLDENDQYLVEGLLHDEYVRGAGGGETMHPADSALSSLPLCDEPVDFGRATCTGRVLIVPGTMTRVRCSRGHERLAVDPSDRQKLAEIEGALRAFERRGGSLAYEPEELR